MCNRSSRTRLRSTYAVLLAPTLFFGVIAPACSSHYKVTDPNSGTTYYTKDVDRDRKGGAVHFKDAKTDAEVTLQSSQVEKISKKDYKAATSK